MKEDNKNLALILHYNGDSEGTIQIKDFKLAVSSGEFDSKFYLEPLLNVGFPVGGRYNSKSKDKVTIFSEYILNNIGTSSIPKKAIHGDIVLFRLINGTPVGMDMDSISRLIVNIKINNDKSNFKRMYGAKTLRKGSYLLVKPHDEYVGIFRAIDHTLEDVANTFLGQRCQCIKSRLGDDFALLINPENREPDHGLNLNLLPFQDVMGGLVFGDAMVAKIIGRDLDGEEVYGPLTIEDLAKIKRESMREYELKYKIHIVV